MSAASAALASDDPTGTRTIRSKGKSEFSSLWRDVRGDIRGELENNPRLRPTADRPVSRQVAEFRDFLERTIEDRVTQPLTTGSVLAGHHFTSSVVDDAFHHGMVLGNAHLRRAGVDVERIDRTDAERLSRREYYNEQLTREYEDTYADIRDNAEYAHTSISQTYRDFAVAGVGVQPLLTGRTETEDGLNNRVQKAGLSPSQRVVDSRVVRTTNEAALLQYQSAGVEQVTPAVELDVSVTSEEGQSVWQTAADGRVCTECASLSGMVNSISDIMQGNAVLPVRDTHDRCRCLYLPYV